MSARALLVLIASLNVVIAAGTLILVVALRRWSHAYIWFRAYFWSRTYFATAVGAGAVLMLSLALLARATGFL